MPVDFQEIFKQVRRWGEEAPKIAQDLQHHSLEAETLLHQYATQLDWLCNRVERVVAQNPSVRCATPAGEPLNGHYACPQNLPPASLLAADGSQVVPNPHARIEFGIVNLGAFHFCLDQGTPPREMVKSTLLDHHQLYTENGLITLDSISLMRDLAERKFLADQAKTLPGPLVALTDGPLEIFSERVYRDSPEYQKGFEEYREVLLQLAELGVINAGYIDRPRYDLVVRLLELAQMAPEDLPRAGRVRPFAGVRDRDLFQEILSPGERSAIFHVQSPSANDFQGLLSLHFFYLNVGREGNPYLARVEIPAWVADDSASVNLLQATLVDQCRILGARPYPYALHRAHEIALVAYAEAEQLEWMLLAEMLRRGMNPGERSNKQSAKDLQGRTRYTV
jgi:hypothetical protein